MAASFQELANELGNTCAFHAVPSSMPSAAGYYQPGEFLWADTCSAIDPMNGRDIVKSFCTTLYTNSGCLNAEVSAPAIEIACTENYNATVPDPYKPGYGMVITIESAKFDASGNSLNGACGEMRYGPMPEQPQDDLFDEDKCMALAEILFSNATAGDYYGSWATSDCITMSLTPTVGADDACEAVCQTP